MKSTQVCVSGTKPTGNLVVSLKEGDYVMIGDAKVTVAKGSRVSLAISAPVDIQIVRGKVLERNAAK